jgi:hypothetical protein
LKNDFDWVVGEVSLCNEAEKLIIQARIGLGVAAQFIVAELLARREEAALGAKLLEQDRRSEELISALGQANLLVEIDEAEYVNAVQRVRNGEAVEMVLHKVESLVKSRKQQKTSTGPKLK